MSTYSHILDSIEEGLQTAKAAAFSSIQTAQDFDHVRMLMEPVARIDDKMRRAMFSIQRDIDRHNAREADLQQQRQPQYARR